MSLGFRLYSYFNGNLVHQDSLGNKYYQDKNNPSKRWVVYAPGFGPESLPTQFHNWLHNTSDEISSFEFDESIQESFVKKQASAPCSTSLALLEVDCSLLGPGSVHCSCVSFVLGSFEFVKSPAGIQNPDIIGAQAQSPANAQPWEYDGISNSKLPRASGTPGV